MATGWWMIGVAGETPRFYSAQSDVRALVACKVEMVDERVREGITDSDAQDAVRKLNPRIIKGPMSQDEAFNLHLGWVWSVAASLKKGEEAGERPLTREDAIQILGEEKADQIEGTLARKYKQRLYPKNRDRSTGESSSFIQDKILTRDIIELHVRDKKNPKEIAKDLNSRGIEISDSSVKNLLKAHKAFTPQHTYSNKRIEIPNLESFAERAANGEAVRTLAEELGISRHVLARRLREVDLTRKTET